jgi:hypothetical protein
MMNSSVFCVAYLVAESLGLSRLTGRCAVFINGVRLNFKRQKHSLKNHIQRLKMYFDWPTKEHDSRRIGTLQELREPRMAEPLRTEEIDSRLKKSACMVDGRIRGLAENQRRVRYFGFETTHEQVKKRTCDELGVCQKINCEVCQ